MKKTTKLFAAAAIAAVGLVAMGCKTQLVEELSSGERADDTVYTNTAVLESLAQSGYVDYRVARFFAFTEMAEFAQENEWSGATLSKTPLVIYSSETGKPRYYEFRVLRNGEEIGAVSCVADKSEGEPVQYVLPFVNAVDSSVTRSVGAGEACFVDTNYPGKLTVRVNGAGRTLSAESGEILADENSEQDVNVRVLLENADEKMLADLGITSDEVRENYLNSIAEEEARLKEFWAKVEELKAQIVLVSDDELIADLSEMERAVLTSSNDYYLNDWYSKKGWTLPSCSRWCGPYAMHLVTLGLGKKSGYAKVPTWNNLEEITTMYQDFEKAIGTGPKVMSQLSGGLSSLTDYKLAIDAFHDWNTINSNVRNTGLPSISLRSSKLFGSLDELQWHYRVITGVKTENYSEQHKFLWWTWESTFSTNWYYMQDNGADGKYFWEAANSYYQLWSAHVVHE